MNHFHLPRSKVTPLVRLDGTSNRLVFEGDCYPENPVAFFGPFLETVASHLDGARPDEFVADFRLRYVNSASTVTLHHLFTLLDRAAGRGARVHVNWVHDPDDDVSEELGHDLSRDCRHVEVVHVADAEASAS
jgi:hypothetical protein